MNLSRADCEALGLDWDALFANSRGGFALATIAPAALPPGPAPKRSGGRRKPAVDAQGRNKTEARFGDGHLAGLKGRGLIAEYRFAPLRLVLAAKTALTPDYVVKRTDNTLALIDVKGGHLEDDAAAKLKFAARDFAWLGDVYLAREQTRNAWLLTPVTPLGGIGRTPDLSWYDPRNP
jgi:hypothetical protein